jgi:hypothetical protein
MKSWRMRWLGHVLYVGEMRNTYKVSVGKPEGKNHFRDLGIGGSVILKWILGNRFGGVKWVHLADMDWLWALVNTVVNLQFL